jgi:hypothetical protein
MTVCFLFFISYIVMLYNLFVFMTVSTSSCIGSVEGNKIELNAI